MTSTPGSGCSVPRAIATPWAIMRLDGIDGRRPRRELQAGLGDRADPHPALDPIPGSSTRRTVTRISAPWVTSGSSPRP